MCEQAGLPCPVAEYKFHPTRKWRIDWYFERDGLRLALEIEGGVWTGGRHTSGAGFSGDMLKYNALAIEKIYLMRVEPRQLLRTKTVELIKTFFDEKK